MKYYAVSCYESFDNIYGDNKGFINTNYITENELFLYMNDNTISFTEVSKKEYLRTKNYKILFFAGSLSSSSLNKIIKEVLTKYVKSDVELFIITGTKDYETFK